MVSLPDRSLTADGHRGWRFRSRRSGIRIAPLSVVHRLRRDAAGTRQTATAGRLNASAASGRTTSAPDDPQLSSRCHNASDAILWPLAG
jgi:hypothetical protein